MPLPNGTRFGHYEILGPLGAGGMGEVYRARDSVLARDVAVKVLPEALARDPERLSRFAREARLLAQLNHTNVATVHGLEDYDGRKLLVMELVEGETLADRIARGAIDEREALEIFGQIAEGLAAAHEKSIVHRDLKPANIKLAAEGRVKILDFGLAKALRPEVAQNQVAQSNAPTVTRNASVEGVILGTAAYMSPEQARGQAVDKRTDIWAFGCCLFESLTGQPAFRGDTMSDTIARILTAEPRWSALPDSLSNETHRLLRHALAKEPARRLKDIGDAFLEPVTVTPSVATGGGNGRRWWPWTGLFLAAATAAFVVGRGSETAPPEAVRFTLDVVDPAATFVDISPDGGQILYVKRTGAEDEDEDAPHILLRGLDSLEPRVLDGTEGASVAAFSPDGRIVAFATSEREGLQTMSVDGGAPEVFSEASRPGPFDIDWVDSGTILLTDQLTTFRIERGASTAVPIATPDPQRGERVYRHPFLLPGGTAALVTLGDSRIDFWDEAAIAVVDLESGEVEEILSNGLNPTYVRTGHLVFQRADQLFAVPFHPESRKIMGSPLPVLDGVFLERTFGQSHYSVSDSGTLVYVSGPAWVPQSAIVWVEPQGAIESLAIEEGPITRLALSPDERHIAFDWNAANASIWVHELGRGTTERFTHEWTNIVPIWAPDGSALAFTSFVGLERRLVTKRFEDATSTEPTVVLGDEPGAVARGATGRLASSWSPSGEELFFQHRTIAGDSDISVVNIEDGTTKVLAGSPYNERRAMISPTGHYLAYQSDETGRFEIYVQEYPAGKRYLASRGGGEAPLWSRSGRELYFRRNDGAVMVVDFRAESEPPLAPPRLLFEAPGLLTGDSRTYDVSPDGKRFLMIKEAVPPPTADVVVVLHWLDELSRLVPSR